MTSYQLAIRYVLRKKSKTILLFLILLFIGSMVLSTSMVLRATEHSKALIQEKTNAKVVLEVRDEKDKITESEIQIISALDGVTFTNRQAYNFVFPANFYPLTNSDVAEEDNEKITLFSYDDLKNDSAFFERRYRIIDGNYIDQETQKGVVINSLLAELNGLKVGDIIELQSSEGVSVSATIEGLFISGSERKQADTTLAVNRVENQIFIDNNTYSQLVPNDGYYKVAVYARNPEELEALETNLISIFSERVVATTSDTLFQQTKAPLEQIIRVVKLMLVLTFITGTTVITILLCMWMRARKKEMAIFISIGKVKISILLQVILETFGVFFVSVAGACVASSFIAKLLEKLLIDSQTTDIMLEVSLKLQDIASLIGIGSLIVLIAVTFSILPILKANPKDILSKMEG